MVTLEGEISCFLRLLRQNFISWPCSTAGRLWKVVLRCQKGESFGCERTHSVLFTNFFPWPARDPCTISYHSLLYDFSIFKLIIPFLQIGCKMTFTLTQALHFFTSGGKDFFSLLYSILLPSPHQTIHRNSIGCMTGLWLFCVTYLVRKWVFILELGLLRDSLSSVPPNVSLIVQSTKWKDILYLCKIIPWVILPTLGEWFWSRVATKN